MQFSRFRLADESAGIRRSNAVLGHKFAEGGGVLVCVEWKMTFPDSMRCLEVAWKCQKDEWVRTLGTSRNPCF
jgi:hypothetical protein